MTQGRELEVGREGGPEVSRSTEPTRHTGSVGRGGKSPSEGALLGCEFYSFQRCVRDGSGSTVGDGTESGLPGRPVSGWR